MSDRKSEFNFDDGRTVSTKLGRTFLMLIVGVFFAIFTALIFQNAGNGWWAFALKVSIETCWTFWVLGLLYIWFDWPWLRSFYLYSERHFVGMVKTLVWTIIAIGLFLISLAVFAVVRG